MELKIKINVHRFISAEQLCEEMFTYKNITSGKIILFNVSIG